MGFKFNKDGVLIVTEDDNEMMQRVSEFVKESGGTVAKAGAAVAVTGAGVAAGSNAAAVGAAGMVVAAAVVENATKETEKVVDTAKMEDAKGGQPYQEVIAEHAPAEESRRVTDEAPAPDAAPDPFAEFRKAMENAGMEGGMQATSRVDDSVTACLPQGEARADINGPQQSSRPAPQR
jgi:hypothetical protein